jgi:hypothetical protein
MDREETQNMFFRFWRMFFRFTEVIKNTTI